MASRAELSTNWRVKSDIPASPAPQVEYIGRQYRRQAQRHRRNEGQNKNQQPLGGQVDNSTSGKDDPLALQAMAEGRRLYVGNMPYMAKKADVEALFQDDAYTM